MEKLRALQREQEELRLGGLDDDDSRQRFDELRDEIPEHMAEHQLGLYKTRDADIEAFKECGSYEELNILMTKAVKLETMSPITGFSYDPTLELAGDSDWWGKTRRWELLVKINEAGVITTNANEGEEQPYHLTEMQGRRFVTNYRCILEFLCERSMTERLIDGLVQDGFIIQKGDNGEFNGDRRPATMYTDIETGEDDAYTNYRVGKKFDIMQHLEASLFDSLNPEFVEKLLNECDFFRIIDPCFNRPADHPNGLFTRVLYHATGVEETEEESPLGISTHHSKLPEPLAAPKKSELAKAQAKAKKYWKQHPRGMKKDMDTKARVVVDTASKYVPNKNDFLGFDDGTHRYQVKWR